MVSEWEEFHGKKASTGHVLLWPDEYVVRIANRWRREMPEVKSVLDLQCGAGRHGTLLAGLGFGVVEADLSATALTQARRAFVEKEVEAWHFVRGSSRSLPFADETFHGLVAWRSLHVFPKNVIFEVVSEMRRVVRKGGPILFSTRTDQNIYDETRVGKQGISRPTDLNIEELESMLRELKLEVLEIELSESTARNRQLRDSYWVVHLRT